MGKFTQFVLLFSCLLLLVGCETVPEKRFRPYKPKSEIEKFIVFAGEGIERELKVKTYKYGRFTVYVRPDGSQNIEGGVYMPESKPDIVSKYRSVIYINYREKTLEAFKFNDAGSYEPLVGYAVVTPSADKLPKDVVRGVVTKIDKNPTWCPTPNIRTVYKHLPAGCLPPGHKDNAMGAIKFEIKWDTPNWELVRLHGTGGYPRGSFWDKETFGCTRLLNEAIINLEKLLGPGAEREGIEIIAYR
ncbi:MAG: hypothetical protein UZ19_OD1000310 [Parcubacteria bacterium OLB19]|nr:MAG: hypothetical protein UZ19_OD1000310 [Parcubacteria bacterium OLB19]